MLDPDVLDERVPHLVIVDDLQDTQNKRIEEFFVKKCHHRNTSCIYIRTYLVRGEDIEHAFECKLYCPSRFNTRSTDSDTR